MDLEHPEISKALLTGYPTNEDMARDNEPIKNNSCDDYTKCERDEQMDNVKDFTVNDILESGAKVDITFYDCVDLQTAYDKLKPYRHLGKVERDLAMNGTVWLRIYSKNIDITAFL